jgi:hypothetical protein
VLQKNKKIAVCFWHVDCKTKCHSNTKKLIIIFFGDSNMKHFLIAGLFALLLVGCDKSNPVEQNSTGEALYSEKTMYKTTVSTDVELSQMQGNGPAHDSLRHGRMLGHLKIFLGLTDAQYDSVKVYAQTVFLALQDIRTQVHDSVITRDQARELVIAVRSQFIASVKLILTPDQIIKFDEWVSHFWNRPPHHRGPGGRGGHGGPGKGRP